MTNFYNYINEGKKWTPKKWIEVYMENMFDNGYAENKNKYPTWEIFFKSAVNGAYDWSEVISDNDTDIKKDYGLNPNIDINEYRDKILKVKSNGFSKEKKLFNSIRKG